MNLVPLDDQVWEPNDLNMDAELGATTSVFPFNAKMAEYLAATERTEIDAEAAKYKDNILSPDAGLKYDQVRFTRMENHSYDAFITPK